MKHSEPARRGDGLSPTDPSLLSSPLDFISADHVRERAVCGMLDRIAADEVPSEGDIAQTMEFLSNELPLHLADEEEDLFPLLRRRCTPEDDIERAIARLTADHRHPDFDTPRMVEYLRQVYGSIGRLNSDARAAVARYASHVRKHLVLENAIVLPLAHVRLTNRDLATLGSRMLKRRGLDGGTEC